MKLLTKDEIIELYADIMNQLYYTDFPKGDAYLTGKKHILEQIMGYPTNKPTRVYTKDVEEE